MAVSFVSNTITFDFTPIELNVSYTSSGDTRGQATYQLTGDDLPTISASHEAKKTIASTDSWFYDLFEMRTDSVDLNNTSIQDIYFRINPDKISRINVNNCSDLKFSNFIITKSTVPATNNADNVLVEQDFVRRIAYEITGGYNRADIFSNETELVSHVSELNVSLASNIQTRLSNASQWAYLDSHSISCNVFSQPLNASVNTENASVLGLHTQLTDDNTKDIYRYLRNLFLKTIGDDNDVFRDSTRFKPLNVSYANVSDSVVNGYTITTYNIKTDDKLAISVEYETTQTINTTNVSQKYKMTTEIS